MKKSISIVLLAASSALLVGCSGGSPAISAPEPGVNTDSDSAQTSGKVVDNTAAAGLTFEHISSCDEVESVMAPYIEGLVQMEGNVADEYGVNCTWTMAEDNTDWANAREVSLGITPVYPEDPKPDIAGLKQFLPETVEVVSDWVAGLDGIAYESRLGTDTIGTIASVVWTPDLQVSVGGGAWENQPKLDGAAAVEVAQQLFG